MTQSDILIVDDTPANLTVLSNILRGEGYQVRVAPNGERALLAAEKDTPDLILLDINLPDINGFEVCRKLKSDSQMTDIPIIFISALDEVDDKVEAFEAGGADYITKPFQIREVLVRVQNQLALRQQRQQIGASLPQLHTTLSNIQLHANKLSGDDADAIKTFINEAKDILKDLSDLTT